MLKGKVLISLGSELRRQEIAGQLAARGFSVRTAAAGEALSRVRTDTPDVIVLDDGLHQTCRDIRESTAAPIVLLNANHDGSAVALGLASGADYCFPGTTSTSELVAHIEAAARRWTTYTSGVHPDRVQVKDLTIDIPAHELRRNGSTIPLSNTEFKLIRALAVSAGKVLSREELLDCVWDVKSPGVYSRTVDVHVARIRRKLGDSAAAQHYIKTIPGFGYVLLTA